MGSVDCAIVTGAGRGIGQGIALELAHAGAHVLALSRTSTCQETERKIKAGGGEAEALQIDLVDPRRAEQAISAWLRVHPSKRIAVVLAAGVLGPKGPLLESDLAEWVNCYAVNVVGNLAVVKGALPTMLSGRFGRIVGFAGGGSAYAYPLFPGLFCFKDGHGSGDRKSARGPCRQGRFRHGLPGTRSRGDRHAAVDSTGRG